MFEPNSRYYMIEEGTYTFPDGRSVAYKRRRFVPQSDRLQRLGEELVRAGDRLDLIGARTLGDPEQFWRVCDCNNALDPRDLLRPGRRLTIASPQP